MNKYEELNYLKIGAGKSLCPSSGTIIRRILPAEIDSAAHGRIVYYLCPLMSRDQYAELE